VRATKHTLLTSMREAGSAIGVMMEAGEATTVEVIVGGKLGVVGSSFATLLAFLARFLRAAANEEVLLVEATDGGGAEATGGGRLIDDATDEATKDATGVALGNAGDGIALLMALPGNPAAAAATEKLMEII
jgi:hypothetical protein